MPTKSRTKITAEAALTEYFYFLYNKNKKGEMSGEKRDVTKAYEKAQSRLVQLLLKLSKTITVSKNK